MPISRPLYELQLLDNQLAQLRRERSHLDDGTSLQDQAKMLQRAIDAADEKLHQSTLARSAKEDELAQREEKLRTQQARLMNAKTAHEVASLQRDIESISKSRGELDEAILTYMEECDGWSAKLEALRSQHDEVSTQLEAVVASFRQESSRLDAVIVQAQTERESACAPLGDEERECYEHSAQRHSGVALTWNENGNCHACGMTLTPYNLKAAKTEEWPTCESCGRLLFIDVV